MSSENANVLLPVMQKVWGFDAFLPLQEQAMDYVMGGQDSLVVLPTGGGKSLCFQAPALCGEGLAVVVSPLISLMKDQVDALQTIGAPAACVNSTTSYQDKRHITRLARSGELKLLYMSPEKLLVERTLEFLRSIDVSFFAIDEAHCISQWGHDFRPEYRELHLLKEKLPQASVHAFTATASEKVRRDIVEQLQLQSPGVLVGSFDRPNLVYKVERRDNIMSQLMDVLNRHQGESGIVYCITRKEVEATAAALSAAGRQALPYHAGMSDQQRRQNQEAFMKESAEIIVATVAFGMGIDKPNVRFVVHTGMPKSLEHYQQESGRAGRDGLEADCVLFYSPADFVLWKKILTEGEQTAFPGALRSLETMMDYCTGVVCRHQALVRFFGQQLAQESCDACDICRGEVEFVEDALVVGQKILSCVLRLEQRFGADYTTLVLVGSQEQRIQNQKHDQLSTYGLLSEFSRRTVRDWIEQLVAQEYLTKTEDFQQLEVTPAGRRLLKGDAQPRLLAPAEKLRQAAGNDWSGVDRELFEKLRALRSEKAAEQDVAAYVIFGDATLRDMARYRPSSLEGLGRIQGVGEKRLKDWGGEFLQCIVEYSRSHELPLDLGPPQTPRPEKSRKLTGSAMMSFPMYEQGASVEEVAQKLGRAVSTAGQYLEQFIRQRRVTDPSPWVDETTIQRVREAARHAGTERLRPIYEFLNEEIPYELIRIVVSCLENES